jgi:hypothetical protein
VKFDWDPKKNEQIRRDRGITFEEISLLLAGGQLWAISEHWNEERYPHQKIFLVPIDEYIYAVPYAKDGDVYFLKTAFPSRKLTRKYKKEIENEKE